MIALACSAACALQPPPPGLSGYGGRSSGALLSIRRTAAAAVGRALADGKELLEIEFPPLLETKTQFDDYSNVEVLDANRDFGVQLALEPEVQAAASKADLWLCFADEGEADLAKEAWPGAMYGEATTTYIASAVRAVGSEPLMPMGSGALDAANAFGALFGKPAPPPPAPPASPPALQLIIQPGDGGPMEDWLNLERLKQAGVPMVCLNGGLDKVTSGYYSNFLNPELGKCSDRFFSQFEQVHCMDAYAPRSL